MLDKVVRVLQENITGIRVIKALSKTDYEKGRFNRVNQELTDIDQRAGVISGITNPGASLMLNLGLTAVVVVGAYLVDAGSCQGGVIVAFLQYFVMILNAMLGVTRIFVICPRARPAPAGWRTCWPPRRISRCGPPGRRRRRAEERRPTWSSGT